MSQKEKHPEEVDEALPRAIGLRLGFLVASLVGLVASIMLIQLHWKAHTRPMERSFCSVHSKVDCLSVAESPFAVFLGVPVAVWATLAFLVLVVGTVWLILRQWRGGKADALAGITFLLAGFSVFMAGVMAYISHALIGVLCIVCAVLYVVNPALLILAWRIAKRHGGVGAALRRDVSLIFKTRTFDFAGFAGGMLAVAGLLMWLYPRYWVLNEPVGPGDLPHGVTKAGHHWIGAKNPELIVHEFSDYQCGFCRRKNAILRQILNKKAYRDRVRLIHYQYPLDKRCNKTVETEYHRRACELARGALCAGKQGRFWHMNDLLFHRQPRPGGPDLIGLAGKLDLDLPKFRACLESSAVAKQVKADIALADKMAEQATGGLIQGTPYYLLQKAGEQPRAGYANEKSFRAALERVPDQHGPGGLPSGVTKEGWEWVGAQKPRLTFYEFSDYQCYYCRRSHFRLRELLKQKEFRSTVRLVKLHYPFDATCNPAFKTKQHPRACALARAAICAGAQNRYWEMNDLIYRRAKAKRLPSLAVLVKALGLDTAQFQQCMTSPRTGSLLRKSIKFAERLARIDGRGIDAVPVIFFSLPPLRMQRAGNHLTRKDLLQALNYKPKKKATPRKKKAVRSSPPRGGG